MNLKEAKYIHFIGIGGIGTSALAQILHEKGKEISGSDLSPSEITKGLKLKKIKVTIGHSAKNISKKHQLVVYSPAIPKSNPELLQAEKLGVKTMTYPQALGELSKEYFTIAIAGTHGKSTTTAMTALVLMNGNLDPNVIIGTKMKELKNKNYRVGESNVLIAEACEYKESFLSLKPNILAITNIEAEHLDYFKTFENYLQTFEKLCLKLDSKSHLIIDTDNKGSSELLEKLQKNPQFKAQVVLNKKSDQNGQIKLEPGVPGGFNKSNASFAAQIGKLLKVENKKIEQAIRAFRGTWRRMQKRHKKLIKATFIDDYAHHPTEIEFTLNAIREAHPKAKILCIFQPHQYSRTKLLIKEFGKCFYSADKVLIPSIYEVRDSEEDIKSVSVDDLVDEINSHEKIAENGEGLKQTAKYIQNNHQKFDIIVTMGAGDINKIYKLL